MVRAEYGADKIVQDRLNQSTLKGTLFELEELLSAQIKADVRNLHREQVDFVMGFEGMNC